MISVSDEQPSTRIDDSGSAREGEMETPKRFMGDLSVDGADDVDDIVEAPSVTTHVADFTQAPVDQILHTSIVSGMGSSSDELQCASIDGSGSVPAGQVDASTSSMVDLSADIADYADVAKAPEAPSVTKHAADSTQVPANLPRYVIVSGMSSLSGDAPSGNIGGSGSVPVGNVVSGVGGALPVVSGDLSVPDRNESMRNRTGGNSLPDAAGASYVGGGTARDPKQSLSPLY